MGMSGSKKARQKAVREGKLNPEALRSEWIRKPYTQVQPNKKADQRRSFCRKPGTSEGADPFFTGASCEACGFSAPRACGRRPA
ncbi:hypothetical protein SAMN05216312_10184 [Cohnella sp. OV330]|nr:hypothetical protein SAMN05216312_10184 [Cohnella sp. OV330]